MDVKRIYSMAWMSKNAALLKPIKSILILCECCGKVCILCIKSSLIMPIQFSSVQFSRSVVSDSCDPMNCSTPGLPVHHQLQEFTQTHVHRVSDAIQPSHPLWSPSPPAPNPSQHQSLFQ